MLIDQTDRQIILKYRDTHSWKRPMGADLIITRIEILKAKRDMGKMIINSWIGKRIFNAIP